MSARRACPGCGRRLWFRATLCNGCGLDSLIAEALAPDPERVIPSDFGARLAALFTRGLREEVVDQLWAGHNESLVAEIERADDLYLKALNEEWEMRHASQPRIPRPTSRGLPAAVAVPGKCEVYFTGSQYGLQSLTLHPVKEVDVIPKAGQEVTVTFRVTQVVWGPVKPS